MRVSYMLPSGTYNIILNKEDFEWLISRGLVMMHTNRIPCVTGRGVYDEESEKMITLDKKEIFNDLRIHINEPVADIEPGACPLQFVNIILDESCGFGKKKEE